MTSDQTREQSTPSKSDEGAQCEYDYTDFHHVPAVTCWLASAPYLHVPFEKAVLAAGPKTPQKDGKEARIIPDDEVIIDEKRRVALTKKDMELLRREILVNPLIWQAGQLYPDVYTSGERVELWLAHFGKENSATVPAAIAWARSQGLLPAHPQLVFSVCAALPELHKKLGSDPVGIISTEERPFDGVWRAPCVWLGSVQREVAFVPSRYPLHDSCWYAFRAESGTFTLHEIVDIVAPKETDGPRKKLPWVLGASPYGARIYRPKR